MVENDKIGLHERTIVSAATDSGSGLVATVAIARRYPFNYCGTILSLVAQPQPQAAHRASARILNHYEIIRFAAATMSRNRRGSVSATMGCELST